MPTPLLKGHLNNPINGERGSIFCPVIEDNFEKLDTHKHTGVAGDFEKIESVAITKVYDTISAGSFVLTDELYVQTITLPSTITASGALISSTNMDFRLSSDGSIIHPSITQVSTISYSISLNQAVNVVVIYT